MNAKRLGQAEVRTFRRIVGCAVALSMAAFAVLGCSGSHERPSYESGDTPMGGAGGGAAEPACKTGEQRLCSVTIEQGNGIISCWQGAETCTDGVWGPCQDGVVIQKPDPSDAGFGGPRPGLAAGPSSKCINQPCDPSCQYWLDSTGVSGGGAACAHDVCTPGVALSATCSPCAQTVCTSDSTCCSASWDNHCTELAYSLCAGTATPPSLCDYGLFSQGSQMTIEGLKKQSSVRIGGDNNITVQNTDYSFRRIVTQGPVRCTAKTMPPEGITAGNNVTLDPPITTTVGPIESGGQLWGQNTSILGKVSAKTNIWLSPGSATGPARSGGTIYLGSGCSAPSCAPNSGYAGPSIALPSVPTLSFSCPAGANQNGASTTLVPGNYGDIVMSDRVVLDGSADAGNPHVFVFNKFYAKNVELRGSGRFTIRTCNEFNMQPGGGGMFQGPGSTAADYLTDPTRLYIEVKGNLYFDSNVRFVGVVNAQNSSTKTGGSILGAIWAHPGNNYVDQDFIEMGMTTEQCLAAGFPGSGRPACTIPNVPAGPTSRVEDYDADCSATPGTVPRWGLLTWDATISGDGTATFEARLGKDQAAAEAAAYQSLGTASAALEDCHLGMLSPCPVDITGKLHLSGTQGSHLQLRVKADPHSGSSQVDKWQLTYSCVYDQ